MAALPQGDEWRQANEEDMSEIQECYCPNCGGARGKTVMLPTKVPLFREIIIVSLTCPVSDSFVIGVMSFFVHLDHCS